MDHRFTRSSLPHNLLPQTPTWPLPSFSLSLPKPKFIRWEGYNFTLSSQAARTWLESGLRRAASFSPFDTAGSHAGSFGAWLAIGRHRQVHPVLSNPSSIHIHAALGAPRIPKRIMSAPAPTGTAPPGSYTGPAATPPATNHTTTAATGQTSTGGAMSNQNLNQIVSICLFSFPFVAEPARHIRPQTPPTIL